MTRAWRPALLLLLTLVMTAWSLSATFDGPFARGWLGHNGARYAQIGRNHERLGLLHMRAAPLLDAEPVAAGTLAMPPARPDIYAHHPPGLGLTLGVVFRVFGVSENAARAVPGVATLLTLVLLAWLVAGVAGPMVGACTAFLAGSMPMMSIYGAHVDVQGPPVLLFSVATLWAYRHMLGGGRWVWLLLASALASAFDWYGLYAPASCALHLWFTQPTRRRAAVGLAAWTGLLFAGWMLWLLTLPGMSWDQLQGAAGVRGWGKLLAMRAQLGPGLSAWCHEVSLLLGGRSSFVLLLLGLIGMLKAWRRPASAACTALAAPAALAFRGPGQGADRASGLSSGLGMGGLLALLIVPPVVHGLLFPTGLLQHGYWLFGLPLGLGLAAALSLLVVARYLRQRARPSVHKAGLGLLALLMLSLAASGWKAGHELIQADSIPALMGTSIHDQTAPGAVVLTSYDCNPLDPDFPAGYVLKHPAVSFYADRLVRGGIESVEGLAQARAALPQASWFLLTPPSGTWVGGQPDPQLAAALRVQSVGAAQELSGNPPVWLYRLRP